MLGKYEDLVEKASEIGIKAYFLKAGDISVENRIALKCAYGCRGYGKRLSCPPYVMSVDEFRKVIGEYSSALLLVDECDTSEIHDILEAWSGLRKDSFHKMFELEQEAFREGFTFAHLLRPGSCNECEACNLEKCVKPEIRRFAPEAVGINVQKAMEEAGLVLEFCKPEKIACVGILLLE
jgi:predicted metal-binding protein